jgi:hypothetical protein
MQQSQLATVDPAKASTLQLVIELTWEVMELRDRVAQIERTPAQVRAYHGPECGCDVCLGWAEEE